MNSQKICIPVMGKTLAELLKNLAQVQKITSCIEIRADSIENLQEADLEPIRKATTSEAIFTCRHVQEGGYHKVHEEVRLRMLQKAIDLGFNYIDVELETCRSKKFVGNATTKVIISYHNFIETPPYFDLTKVLDDIRSFHPDIMK